MVVLFNAQPSGRIDPLANGLGTYNAANQMQLRRAHLRSSGFNVQWQSSAGTTRVIIADLDPAKTWQYRVNGGGSQTLRVTKSGVAAIDVTGTRTHTLTVS
jgi:hypothetical protein